jgi:hypothetical protein
MPTTDALKPTTSGEAAAAGKSNEPLLKFSLSSGKLEIGSLYRSKNIDLRVGEIKLYRWGVAGFALVYCKKHEHECLWDYCKKHECLWKIVKWTAEIDNTMYRPKHEDTRKNELPN